MTEFHNAFLEVGVDVIETNTFGAFAVPLAEYGIADRAYELARAGAEIARGAADAFASEAQPRWVAGSMGPGTKMPSLGQIRYADLRDTYAVEASGLLDGGVDLLIIETMYDLLAAKAAIAGSRRAMERSGVEVPLQVQVTIETTGRMLPGTEIGAALAALAPLRPDVFGLNCATGPAEMHEPLRHLSRHSPVPISVIPNAGLPSVVDGDMRYGLTPEELATTSPGSSPSSASPSSEVVAGPLPNTWRRSSLDAEIWFPRPAHRKPVRGRRPSTASFPSNRTPRS